MVPPDPQRPGVRRRGPQQPRPAGRRAGHPRLHPRRPRHPARRQPDPSGRLRQPHRPAEDEGRRQGRARPPRQGPGHVGAGDPQQGPAVRRQDAAALLERLALPAHPDHRRGHHPAGTPDPRALRGLPRHLRRAHRRTPLRRARQGPDRPGPRLPLAGHRRGDPKGQEHPLAAAALGPDRPLRAGAHLRQPAARQGRGDAVRGRQPRPGHRQGQERQGDPRLQRRHEHRRPRPGHSGTGTGAGDEGRP